MRLTDSQPIESPDSDDVRKYLSKFIKLNQNSLHQRYWLRFIGSRRILATLRRHLCRGGLQNSKLVLENPTQGVGPEWKRELFHDLKGTERKRLSICGSGVHFLKEKKREKRKRWWNPSIRNPREVLCHFVGTWEPRRKKTHLGRIKCYDLSNVG